MKTKKKTKKVKPVSEKTETIPAWVWRCNHCGLVGWTIEWHEPNYQPSGHTNGPECHYGRWVKVEIRQTPKPVVVNPKPPEIGKCFFCGRKVVECNYCYGCSAFVCPKCDKLQPYGRPHEPGNHKVRSAKVNGLRYAVDER